VHAHVREEAEEHWLVLSGHLLWLGFNTGAIQPPRELLGAMSVHKAENRKGKNHQQMTAGSHLDPLEGKYQVVNHNFLIVPKHFYR